MVVIRQVDVRERGESFELPYAVDGRRPPDDPELIGSRRGERRPVPAGTYRIVADSHEPAVAQDPNRLESTELVYLIIDLDGEHAVVLPSAGRRTA